MKLNRTKFWIGIIILWGGLVVFVLNNPEYEIGVFPLIIYLLVYLTLIVLRLRDAGKNGAMVLLCFLLPMMMFYFGCLPTEKLYFEKVDEETEKVCKL